jgi:hypothetical protein
MRLLLRQLLLLVPFQTMGILFKSKALHLPRAAFPASPPLRPRQRLPGTNPMMNPTRRWRFNNQLPSPYLTAVVQHSSPRRLPRCFLTESPHPQSPLRMRPALARAPVHQSPTPQLRDSSRIPLPTGDRTKTASLSFFRRKHPAPPRQTSPGRHPGCAGTKRSLLRRRRRSSSSSRCRNSPLPLLLRPTRPPSRRKTKKSADGACFSTATTHPPLDGPR